MNAKLTIIAFAVVPFGIGGRPPDHRRSSPSQPTTSTARRRHVFRRHRQGRRLGKF